MLAKYSLNLLLAYQLGKLYLKTKNHQKAIAVFKNLIERDAKNAYYSYQLGLSYAVVKERDLMINSFLNVHKKDTTHVRTISKWALSFLKLRDRDASYLLVNKGLELELNHTSLNRIRVNQFYTEKQYKETIPVLLKLDSIKKMGLYTNTMLVKAYYNLEDFENAKLRF